MGVSDHPDIDQETPIPNGGRGNGNGGRRNGGAKKRRASQPLTDQEVSTERPHRERGTRNASRERTLRQLLEGLRALDEGDFRTRLTPNGDPLMAEVVDVFNSVATRHERLSEEIKRVSFAVDRAGNMRERIQLPGQGSWGATVDSVNTLIADLVQPTTEVSRVIKAVAEGDLSQKVELEIDGKTVQGEFFRIGSTGNRMVDQLRAFSNEVTRVAREVGA